MALHDGSYQLGPDAGRLLVRTGRTGLGSRAGHDLTIGALSWSGTVVVDTSDPGRSSVSIDVGVASLHVVGGSGGVKPLSDSDRADIERIMRDKILDSAKYPMITFRSTRVSGTSESFTVDGELTIRGTTHTVTANGSAGADSQVRATATVSQSRWGIKPYSAFLGALKVADDVVIEVEVTLETPTPPA